MPIAGWHPTQVLDGLNLTIEAGTTVALVGRSGCGKSTIVSLIQRFYDPDSGTVSLDDLGPLTELDVESVRSVMGLVGQEPVLFDNTIRGELVVVWLMGVEECWVGTS
mgnify:CR=1 FL=1